MGGARKTDAAGRSTGKALHQGRVKRWKCEGPFMMHPRYLLASPAYRGLNPPARHVLDFLELEHLDHGGAENGRLLAPYSQLEKFGLSGRDIRPALTLLIAFGIIRVEKEGGRLGGQSEAAEYRLTWLPSGYELPTDDFKKVSQAEVNFWRAELKADAAHKRNRRAEARKNPAKAASDATLLVFPTAATTKRQGASSQDIDSTPHLSGGNTSQMTGKNASSGSDHQSIEGRTAGQLRGEARSADTSKRRARER